MRKTFRSECLISRRRNSTNTPAVNRSRNTVQAISPRLIRCVEPQRSLANRSMVLQCPTVIAITKPQKCFQAGRAKCSRSGR